MNDLLTTGSVLAAFFAGAVALFAPCCIVFLAPSYMAVAVKNRRWRLLPLTFVFAAGLAAVMVPITLGLSLLAGAIAQYHGVLYTVGGLFMLLLAAWALTGRMWALPSFISAPDTRRGDSASFFGLGVFSGVASACCAPVLAGVMTLSALSGSAVGGTVLGLAYVFGMTFPLFVMALAWDRFDLGRRSWLQAKPVTIPLPRGRALHTNSVNLIVAAAFTVMGVFVLRLASSGTMTSGPGMQVAVGDWLAGIFRRIEDITAPVPEPILGAALLGLVAVFVVAMLRRRGEDPDLDDDGVADVDPHASCHPAATSTTTSHDQESSS